jgi:hypothetical protein
MTLEGPSPAGCRPKFHLGLVQPAVSFVERASAVPDGGLTDVELQLASPSTELSADRLGDPVTNIER